MTNVSSSKSSSVHNFNMSAPLLAQNLAVEAGGDDDAPGMAPLPPRAQRGTAAISEFNRDPFSAAFSGAYPGQSALAPQEPQYNINDTTGVGDFIIDRGISVAATRRFRETINGATLNIWVANDCWNAGGTKTYTITPAMVTALAQEFLLAGSSNDIYDWVTGIYGAEWGNHSYPEQLIAPDNNITILLFDIDNDNTAFLTKGYTSGYFYSKDNFLTSRVSISNERIMFYIDAVAFAYPSGSWDITDQLPADTVLTLAHELQHMIHFYQKNVLRAPGGSGTETGSTRCAPSSPKTCLCDKLGASFFRPRGIA
jgi:hypothetical protein